MMEVLEKIKLNLGADIAAIFLYKKNTCLASCQKFAEP
jgi:hypothetical protein